LAFLIEMALAMDGFHWLIAGKIAGSPRPRSPHDVVIWRSLGIAAIVSLTEDELDFTGFHVLHLPGPDWAAPSIAQLNAAIAFIDECFGTGIPVVVHCAGGKGRTGTVLASWLISQGSPASIAIRRIRELSPGSIETLEQVRALETFQSRRASQ